VNRRQVIIRTLQWSLIILGAPFAFVAMSFLWVVIGFGFVVSTPFAIASWAWHNGKPPWTSYAHGHPITPLLDKLFPEDPQKEEEEE
jgi:hypothetical protein